MGMKVTGLLGKREWSRGTVSSSTAWPPASERTCTVILPPPWGALC